MTIPTHRQTRSRLPNSLKSQPSINTGHATNTQRKADFTLATRVARLVVSTVCSNPNAVCKLVLQVPLTRRYSTAPSGKSSNLGFYLIGASAVGLGGYTYLNNSQVSTKKTPEKSPLDPQNFVDFELKKVERYNHNTSR
jgi:hypothetical protein